MNLCFPEKSVLALLLCIRNPVKCSRRGTSPLSNFEKKTQSRTSMTSCKFHCAFHYEPKGVLALIYNVHSKLLLTAYSSKINVIQ